MGSHTLQQLKRYSFDELKELFETTMRNVTTFVPMETKDRERASELVAGSSQATIIDSAEVGSSKRAAEAEFNYEGSKRQKTNEASRSVQEQPEEEELSQDDLQQMMMVVPVEKVYVEALQVKYPIIDWEGLYDGGEGGNDFRVDVLRFHTCLTDILGFLEKLEWWFEQDIDDEGE
ncbi:hypothetical protein Tco_0473109 [Tanacetum coccineum]